MDLLLQTSLQSCQCEMEQLHPGHCFRTALLMRIVLEKLPAELQRRGRPRLAKEVARLDTKIMVDFAFWHDAGKLSEKSFFGQDRLFFQSDRVRLQDHCVAGYDYARSRPGLAETAILILFHHEHWNGTGYFGLIGRDIPLACRLLAILDAYDVVRAGRSYSSSHSPRQAKALILAGSGSQFDPRLASATMNILQT